MVVADESETFWPVSRSYCEDTDLTEVNAAAIRHPTLATVWLGANDVLKYMGSGGRFVGGDRNAAQAEGDLRERSARYNVPVLTWSPRTYQTYWKWDIFKGSPFRSPLSSARSVPTLGAS